MPYPIDPPDALTDREARAFAASELHAAVWEATDDLFDALPWPVCGLVLGVAFWLYGWHADSGLCLGGGCYLIGQVAGEMVTRFWAIRKLEKRAKQLREEE